MGIHCEINVFKPSDGVFVPGETITGVIKYALNEDTVLKRITVSLKGQGNLFVKDKRRRRKERRYRFRNREEIVDKDYVVRQDEKGFALSVGSYEAKFSFKLPENVPASLIYRNNTTRYFVKCNIMYYIRIKFDKIEFYKFAKRCKKEITVVSGITPNLPTMPTIYGERAKICQFFSCKRSIINVKASVENSVVQPGGKIELNYEVFNDTNVVIKGVETKLVEVYTFVNKTYRNAIVRENVINTDTKTGSVNRGETQSMDIKIDIPSDKGSLEHSKIVSRDYFIHITAELPMPHSNVVLEIPVQIGDQVAERENANDPPPSYWEVMAEDIKGENKDDNDDEDENE